MAETWTDFLTANSYRYLPAKQWQESGVSEADAWATCERGDWLLWLAGLRGYAGQDTLDDVACALVDKVKDRAPDVADITACYKVKGGRIAAYHEKMAVEAIEAERLATIEAERELAIVDMDSKIEIPITKPVVKPEPIAAPAPAPVITPTADIVAGAAHARMAAGFIVDNDMPKMAFFALRAAQAESQAALNAACGDATASKGELKVLKDASKAVEKREKKAQVDLVRSKIGGPV